MVDFPAAKTGILPYIEDWKTRVNEGMKKLETTVQYSAAFAAFWAIDCTVIGYASVFLQANDYSNTIIGVILSAANLLSVAIQISAADIADRSKKLNLFDVVIMMAVAIMVSEMIVLLLKGRTILMFLAYTVVAGVHLAHQPQLNAMSGILASRNLNADYGICRGTGSLCYAATSLLMGVLVAKAGVIVLGISNEVFVFILIVASAAMGRNYRKASPITQSKAEAAENIQMSEFISRHKMFLVMCIGILILFYQQQVTNNFMLQIFQANGGGTRELSIFFCIMPLTETAVFWVYAFLKRFFSVKTLLKFSTFMFIIRGLLLVLASSSTGVILSLIAHPFCFPLFLASIVDYINGIMDHKEVVRGQSLYVVVITISALITSLTGGAIIDMWGAKMLLIVALVSTVAGVGLVLPMVSRAEKEIACTRTDS